MKNVFTIFVTLSISLIGLFAQGRDDLGVDLDSQGQWVEVAPRTGPEEDREARQLPTRVYISNSLYSKKRASSRVNGVRFTSEQMDRIILEEAIREARKNRPLKPLPDWTAVAEKEGAQIILETTAVKDANNKTMYRHKNTILKPIIISSTLKTHMFPSSSTNDLGDDLLSAKVEVIIAQQLDQPVVVRLTTQDNKVYNLNANINYYEYINKQGIYGERIATGKDIINSLEYPLAEETYLELRLPEHFVIQGKKPEVTFRNITVVIEFGKTYRTRRNIQGIPRREGLFVDANYTGTPKTNEMRAILMGSAFSSAENEGSFEIESSEVSGAPKLLFILQR